MDDLEAANSLPRKLGDQLPRKSATCVRNKVKPCVQSLEEQKRGRVFDRGKVDTKLVGGITRQKECKDAVIACRFSHGYRIAIAEQRSVVRLIAFVRGGRGKVGVRLRLTLHFWKPEFPHGSRVLVFW